jgi:hypothetical protein
VNGDRADINAYRTYPFVTDSMSSADMRVVEKRESSCFPQSLMDLKELEG